ncbi:MAG: dTDP-4-dehydrorhamnose reductase [Alphaproteobacteria bacterium]
MRVAVIGSTGQLGSDLVQVLAESGSYAVTSLSHAQVDVTNRQSVMEALGNRGFDAVVNCAAFTRVDDCEDFPNEALLVNAQGAFEVARVCAASNTLCTYISTDYVFSGEKGSSYSEDDPTIPINVYGASKLAGEFLVRQTAKKWLILRISSVFGKTGSRGKGGNFVETILARARSGLPVQVVNDIWMSPTYTMDAARLIEELIRAGATGLFHGSNTGRCTWFEFASEAIRMIGFSSRVGPVSSASYPSKARRPRDSSLSNSYLEKTLGRSARPWRDALRSYLIEKGYL